MTGCIEWTGGVLNSGYGQGKRTTAHREAWACVNGPVPDGLCVLHRCDNRLCVNPDHLFVGTQAENIRDMYQKGREPRAKNQARLTASDVKEIRRLSVEGAKRADIARRFCISETMVSRIRQRRSWGHITESDAGEVPKNAIGSRSGRAKLNEQDVVVIRERMGAGEKNADLAREYGVDRSIMSLIRHRKIWTHVA